MQLFSNVSIDLQEDKTARDQHALNYTYNYSQHCQIIFSVGSKKLFTNLVL